MLAACESSTSKPAQTATNDGVPANSLAEERLAPEPKPVPTATSQTTSEDPTQPYVQRVGETPPEPAEKPEKASGGSKKGSKEMITKQECESAFDKYLELEIAQNPKLRGVPPEVIAQAKEMARQKDTADCKATKAQYHCAMAATSTAAWQRCMK